MKIDEERIYSLTKFSNKKGAKDLKESDHNTMILKVKTNWKNLGDDKDIRTEIYNFKKKDDFTIFQVETSNNEELRACFNDENDDLEVSSKRWLSILNKIIIKCFKRIRLNKKKSDKDLEVPFAKKEKLKTELSAAATDDTFDMQQAEEDLENVLEEISAHCGKKNKDLAEEYLAEMNDPLEGFNLAKTWSLKKKLAPKTTVDPPMAMKDK